MYNDEYYDQVDGVAMGSPLGPVLANLFMGVHEKTWLREYRGSPVLFYKRYVDDIFCMFGKKEDAMTFLEYLNDKHPNIKFTLECEEDGKLAFLDVLVMKDLNGDLSMTTYRKPTNTGLLTNFLSFTAYSYKVGLIKCLCDRAHKINSSDELRNADLSFISGVLQKNSFPKYVIDKVFGEYGQVNEPSHPNDAEAITQEPRNYKLPYVGSYSVIAKKKIKSLLSNCHEIDIRLIFVPFKIGQYFSAKCKIPEKLVSHVVYKFNCASCNAMYIGETTKHNSVRTREHLHTDKKSSVYKHLRNNVLCKNACTEECFSILDKAPTDYQLKIKEGLLIGKYKPVLNKQVHSYKARLVL